MVAGDQPRRVTFFGEGFFAHLSTNNQIDSKHIHYIAMLFVFKLSKVAFFFCFISFFLPQPFFAVMWIMHQRKDWVEFESVFFFFSFFIINLMSRAYFCKRSGSLCSTFWLLIMCNMINFPQSHWLCFLTIRKLDADSVCVALEL